MTYNIEFTKGATMAIQIPTELLDGAVLAILARENLYGYALTKHVQAQLPVSESTMYPVLRRLKKNEALTTYDEPFEGRMRRYYQLTAQGRVELARIQADWQGFSTAMNRLLTTTEPADAPQASATADQQTDATAETTQQTEITPETTRTQLRAAQQNEEEE